MVDYLLDTFSQHFWQLCTHFRRNGKNYSVVTVRTERQAAIIHFQLGLASQALFLDEFKRPIVKHLALSPTMKRLYQSCTRIIRQSLY